MESLPQLQTIPGVLEILRIYPGDVVIDRMTGSDEPPPTGINRDDYYLVMVFDTHDSFAAYCHTHLNDQPDDTLDTQAIFCPSPVKLDSHSQGTLAFHCEYFDLECLVHQVTHAAIHYLSSKLSTGSAFEMIPIVVAAMTRSLIDWITDPMINTDERVTGALQLTTWDNTL